MTKKRHNNVLKAAKGYRWNRSRTFKKAKEAVIKAGRYAYRDRAQKKRHLRSQWIVNLNNALRMLGLTYSTFIPMLTAKKADLDRKVLSQLDETDMKAFEQLVYQVKA